MVGRIVEAAGDVPVSADLDDGYEDVGETTRRAIGVGIVGSNVEDRLRPVAEAAARVESIADAIERGRAYLAAGADVVFVPGVLSADVAGQLVEGIGERKVWKSSSQQHATASTPSPGSPWRSTGTSSSRSLRRWLSPSATDAVAQPPV